MHMPPAVILFTQTFQVVTHAERAVVMRDRHTLPRNIFFHVHGEAYLELWDHLQLCYGLWVIHLLLHLP